MKRIVAILAVAAIVIAGLVVFTANQPEQGGEELSLKPFSSPDEFKDYLVESSQSAVYFPLAYAARVELTLDSKQVASGEAVPTITATPARYSETNVQVKGIDEPDIVKTDGVNIYYSPFPFRIYFQYPEKYYIEKTRLIRHSRRQT